MGKIPEFVRMNGWYLLIDEVFARIGATARGTTLNRRLGTKGLRLGPGSYIRGLGCMKIGADVHAGRGLWLQAITRYRDQRFTPRIVIGDSVRISHYVHIAATHYVEIGDHCLFGSKALVTDHNHGQYTATYSSPNVPPSLRALDNDRSVKIGRNVWIGDGVVIGPGANIGEGCIVGANSVVRGSLPPFSISSGNPATVFKKYDFDRQEWIGSE
jgi:lipopolysaccharide O-acetyltransferase